MLLSGSLANTRSQPDVVSHLTLPAASAHAIRAIYRNARLNIPHYDYPSQHIPTPNLGERASFA